MEQELRRMFEIKETEMSVPSTLSPELRNRIGRQRMVMGGLVAAAALALVISGFSGARSLSSDEAPPPANHDSKESPFVDTWVNADPDGSTQTMVVRASDEGAYEILLKDDAATVCSGAPATITGTGRLDGAAKLVIPSPVLTCDDGSEPKVESGPPLEELLRNMTFVHDPEDDTLTDNFGLVWGRGKAPRSDCTPPADPESLPPPSTSARHSPRPGEATFTSTIHGISIDYPSGWQTRPATEPWTCGELNYDSPAADVIFDPAHGDRLYLVLASQPLGRVSEDAWRDQVGAWLCTGNGAAFGWETVDGADAFVITCGSTASAALTFTDGRGYLIRLVVSSDEPGLAETYDSDWHMAMLETVDLRP